MAELKTTVELTFRCEGLRSLDTFSKSDPMVVVFVKRDDAKYYEIGRTEVIKDELNPVFKTNLQMDYLFEQQQHLKIIVFDVDDFDNTKDLTRQDFIGDCYVTVSEIVGSKGSTICRAVKSNGRDQGKIFIKAEELKSSNEKIRFRFAGVKLDQKDFFGKSDPYFIISRLRADGSMVQERKSEVITSNLNPTWTAFEISTTALCNANYAQKFRVQVWDWDRLTSHDLIGTVDLCLNDILPRETQQFTLTSAAKKSAGKLHILEAEVIRNLSFLDYIQSGYEISAAFAIDFTASNGQPSLSHSLHYRNPYQPNEYQQAIVSIGEIIENYDSDKRFPVLGFGGKINDAPHHCFFLNNNPSNPEVVGIQGILDAYSMAINRIPLWGPTNFAPIIDFVARLAYDAKMQRLPRYYIFVIITDGEISDMDDTRRAIIRASALPLSIIIVGVGSSSTFENMTILDGDNEGGLSDPQLGSAQRDVVQFVQFSKHKHNPQSLAAETLKEVPGQLLSYMKSQKLLPLSRPTAAQPPPPVQNSAMPGAYSY